MKRFLTVILAILIVVSLGQATKTGINFIGNSIVNTSLWVCLLKDKLRASGDTLLIDFVGNRGTNNHPSFANASDELGLSYNGVSYYATKLGYRGALNDGWSGYTTSDILTNLGGWIRATTPDIFVIHIGANDFWNPATMTTVNGMIDDVEDMIDTIRSVNANAKIILCKIIPVAYTANSLQYSGYFADSMTAIQSRKHTVGSPIYVLDLKTGFNTSTMYADAAKVHPNELGATFMANATYPLIHALLHPIWVTAYYAGWMQSTLPASAIDYSAMTHICYFSGYCDASGGINWSGNGVTYNANAQTMVTLAHAAGVKVIITVGGWDTQTNFRNACSNGTSRATLIHNWMNYIRSANMDGADVDWEPLSSADQTAYLALAKDFRDSLNSYELVIGRDMYLLMATQWGASVSAAAYSYFDQVNLMTYDLAGLWTGWVTWHNAAIYDANEVPGQSISANALVNNWNTAGVPLAKLGIGIDFYGYKYSGVTAPRQSISGGTLVQSNRPYSTIMSSDYPSMSRVWDAAAQAVYINNGSGWVTYDDQQTCAAKVEYARAKGIGGVIIWELGGGYRTSLSSPALKDSLLQAVKTAVVANVVAPIANDTTSPSVSITAPTTGSTLTGTVTFSATATDNVGITSVIFKVGTTTLSTDVSSPYSYSWITNATPNGTYKLYAVASDAVGNSKTDSISVTINNVVDATSPTVSITSPLNGATVAGTVSITATASDNIGVYGVQFKLNGANLGSEDLVSPYTYSWNTTLLTNNVDTLTATARDAAGNSTTSSLIIVTIYNVVDYTTKVLRDDYNRGDRTTVTGDGNWADITGSPGTIQIVSNQAKAYNTGGNNTFGGNVWDTLMTGGTEAGIVIAQKSGNGSYSSLFIYCRMSNKTYSTGTGYRLKYMEGSGLTIQRMSSYTANVADIATSATELSVGDTLTLRVNADNTTMVVYVNSTQVMSVNDVTYSPTSWYFAVRSLVSATNFIFDDWMVSSEPTGAPATPILSYPADASVDQDSNSVTLGWNEAVGATSYKLQVSENEDFSDTLYNDSTLTTTSQAVTGFAGNTQYFWRVSAKNGTGSSAFSSVWDFTTIAPLPAVPDTVTLTYPINDSTDTPITPTMQWDSVSTAVTYRLIVAYDSISFYPIFDDSTLTDTFKVVPQLSGGTKYYWKVRAKNTGGNGGYSDVWHFTTVDSTPSVPVPLYPTDGATGITVPLSLDWDDVPSATMYYVKASTSMDFVSYVIDDSTVNSSYLADTFFTAKTYYWKVSAKNASGESDYCTRQTFSTIDMPPKVTIVYPADGATISGIIRDSVYATDDKAIVSVQWSADGVNLGSLITSAPYGYSWNTYLYTNGTYVLTVSAKDETGSTNESSDAITVYINNSTRDTTDPVTTITDPSEGDSVNGTISLTATATDDGGIAGVQFKLNGVVLGSQLYESPYTYSWNTEAYENGDYVVTATSWDMSGNSSDDTINVVINNTSAVVYTNIFNDDLLSPYFDYSIGSTIVTNSTEHTFNSSSRSIKVTQSKNGYFGCRSGNKCAPVPIDMTDIDSVQFDIYVVATEDTFILYFWSDTCNTFPIVSLDTVAADSWRSFSIAKSEFNPTGIPVDGLCIKEVSGLTKVYYIDNLRFYGH